jgi:DNA-binding LytR/AlgR family response regulator
MMHENRKERKVRMQIEIKIDDACREPKIIILTDKITEEINTFVRKLSVEPTQVLSGFRGETAEVLEPSDIFRIYASSGKVFAITEKGEYTLRLRLYELEERLDQNRFVRISNSEIINLKKVKRFDLSLTGTICVSLSDGAVTYVSRRYVSKIKQVLGV